MTLSLFWMSNSRVIDSSGNPIAGAKLNFYTSGGTSFRQDTYNDSDGIVGHKNANPVVADSGGLFGAIYLQPLAYYVELTTSAGAVIWSQDDVWLADFSVLTDDLWILRDNADQTKKIQFQVSPVTAGQTRTITVIDSDMEMGHSGEYTPTLTNGANVAASTPHISNYVRVGNYVVVAFAIDVDPTLAGPTATALGISLPIASDFSLSTDCAGSGVSGAVFAQAGMVSGDAANNRAQLDFVANSLANVAFIGTFVYRIR